MAGVFRAGRRLYEPRGSARRRISAPWWHRLPRTSRSLLPRLRVAGQRGTLSAVIETDKKAITIRVDDVLGVAGFVQPDDRVDVLLTRNDRPMSASPSQAPVAAYSDLLLQNARVLAIDQIADRSGQAKPAKAVTIEVTTEDAQKVALGASVGQLSLALRQAGSVHTTESRRIGLEDLSKLRQEVEDAKPAFLAVRS